MPDLAYWRRVPAWRRWLLLEASASLLATRLALKLAPFRRLTWLFERPARQPELTGPARTQLKREVRWAIRAAAHVLPGKFVCFPRAMTAQSMLRRRGISTTLYYGALRLPERGLTAHVWVQDGDEGVVGSRAARGHTVLARYPAR
jgi:hypothetical protein